MSDPERPKPPFTRQQGDVLADELNAILAERDNGPQEDGAVELVGRLVAEAARIPGREDGPRAGEVGLTGPSTDSVRVLQRAAMEKLREKGYGSFESVPEAVEAMGAGLVRQRTLEDLELNQADRVAFVSMVVLATKPEHNLPGPGEPVPEDGPFRQPSVPKRKGESNEYAALRAGLTYMREASGEAATHLFAKAREFGRQVNSGVQQARAEAEADPGNEEKAETYQRGLASLERVMQQYSIYRAGIKYSRLFMHALTEGEISVSGGQASVEFWAEAREVSALPEAEQLDEDWIILPREPTERAQVMERETAGLPEEIRRYRQERIDELEQIVEDWGEGEVRISQLRGSGGDRYYVARLPQTMPDGTVIEHAVVDNPVYGNARFVWRAEQGQTHEGQPLTWREVFGRYKSVATDLGAKWIPHRGDWQAVTVEYLTRDAAELPKKPSEPDTAPEETT